MAAARSVGLALLLLLGSAAHAAGWESFFDPFLGDLRAEAAEARSARKAGVMVMYHFDACPYCTRMKTEVLMRPDVQRAFRRDFQSVAIDTRGAQPITGFDGRTLPEKDYARSVDVRATPTFDFYGAEGKRLYRHVGGIFDPAEFVVLGRYVASGAHRSLPFDEYKQRNKGS
jgi:thioredoxin-related protein